MTKQSPNWMRLVHVSLLALICAACNPTQSSKSKEPLMYEPPLKRGQKLDPNSEYAKYWPGQPVLFRLNENWGFAIPPQYMKFWIQKDRVVRAPAPWNEIPIVQSLGFQFFMPDFGGWTPDNYTNESFHEDMVNVVDIQPVGLGSEKPGAPGYYPPNMFARASAQPHASFDPGKYEEKYGLRCYDFEPKLDRANNQYCYGLRDAKHGEYILLDITAPPYADYVRYPNMQARYFTPQYGGLVIVWRANMKHFKDWQLIDRQVWKFFEEWQLPIPTSPTVIQKG